MQQFSDQYYILNHEYHHLSQLIDYVNLLSNIDGTTKVVFINGLIPWKSDLLNLECLLNPAKFLSDYTKELLDFDNRSDNELGELFTQLHDKVETMDYTMWVNMFDSMDSLMIDYGNDGEHPGIKSHTMYANMIIDHIEKRYEALE
jgi:hypothetical protein